MESFVYFLTVATVLAVAFFLIKTAVKVGVLDALEEYDKKKTE